MFMSHQVIGTIKGLNLAPHLKSLIFWAEVQILKITFYLILKIFFTSDSSCILSVEEIIQKPSFSIRKKSPPVETRNAAQYLHTPNCSKTDLITISDYQHLRKTGYNQICNKTVFTLCPFLPHIYSGFQKQYANFNSIQMAQPREKSSGIN